VKTQEEHPASALIRNRANRRDDGAPHRFALSPSPRFFIVLLLACVFAAPIRAAMFSSGYGIDGFDIRNGKFVWWNNHGVCGGEFPNLAVVQYAGGLWTSPKTVATNCNILTGYFDTAVIDDAYAYYFAGRQLMKKALNAALTNAAQAVSTPPFSPTLASGQLGSPLEMNGTTLYFARFTNATGGSMIYSFDLGATNSSMVAEGGFDADSEVAEIKYFEYDDGNGLVRALAVLTESGRLYRIKLDPGREAPLTLLATGVSYFAVRNGNTKRENTYLFATKGVRAILGDIAPGGPGTLWRVDPERGAETLLYTAQDENVLIGVAAVGMDTDDVSYLFVSEGIVSGPPGGFKSITEVALRRHSATVLSGSWDTIMLEGAGWNLRPYGLEKLFMLREDAIDYVLTGSDPIRFDLRAVGLEAVQAIQSFQNAVPLVANRPIYVRAYATLETNTTLHSEWYATATLRAFLNGEELPGGPIAPINSVPVKQVADLGTMRANTTNTFLFELPPEWTRPGPLAYNFLQFRFTVNPDLAIPETPSNPLANNTFVSGTIPIVRGGTPCLVMVPVHSIGPEYHAVDDPEFPSIIERARSLMPVEDFQLHVFYWPAGDPDDPLNFKWQGSTAETQAERDEENRDHRNGEWGQANDQAEDAGQESDICDTDDVHYVAMVHADAAISPPGGQGEAPGNAFGIWMLGADDRDDDPTQEPRGGRILAHELAHNYGRKHIACGSFPPDQADFDPVPWPGSLGIPIMVVPEATFGFDPLSFRVLRPIDACDIMSYSTMRWTTEVYWNALLGEIPKAAFAPARTQRFSAKGADPLVLLVSGRIFPSARTALLRRFSVIPESQAPAGNVARSRREARDAEKLKPPYLLRQLDGAGTVLLDTPILPRNPSTHESGDMLRFSQYVDFDPGARTLQLVWSNLVFAERFISPNPPILEVRAPVLDAAAETLSLSWDARDPDGDPLRFSIHYSGDDGLHWAALKTDYRALSITLGTRWLAGGPRCRLRVIAHDGVNSTIGITPSFASPKHAPEPRVFGVRNGQRIPFGQPCRFRAVAFDAEEGSTSLNRFWNLAGPEPRTHTGDSWIIPCVVPGLYVLRFTAVDSDGMSNVVTRSFEIAPMTIPEAAATPVLDGQPNDRAYANAAFVQLPFGTMRSPARLVHRRGYLYVSIANLRYASPLLANNTVGLRFDVNASRNPTASAGDVGFFVDEDGVPFQEVAQGGSMVQTLSPQPGFTAVIERGSNVWSAELRIATSLIGGWNHAAA